MDPEPGLGHPYLPVLSSHLLVRPPRARFIPCRRKGICSGKTKVKAQLKRTLAPPNGILGRVAHVRLVSVPQGPAPWSLQVGVWAIAVTAEMLLKLGTWAPLMSVVDLNQAVT